MTLSSLPEPSRRAHQRQATPGRGVEASEETFALDE
jgi:hypothetical protein